MENGESGENKLLIHHNIITRCEIQVMGKIK